MTVELRHILVVSADGEQFDAFLKNIADNSIVVPASLKIVKSCIVEVRS